MIFRKTRYLAFDKNLKVTFVSSSKFEGEGQRLRRYKGKLKDEDLVGKKLPQELIMIEDYSLKENKELKVAFVCNWNDQCGISTYSEYLVTEMRKQCKDIHIFSEQNDLPDDLDGDNVTKCWRRGEPLLELVQKIKDYGPDFIIIQHEFGIYPNAFHFMKFMQEIDDIPYVVTMHSVYQHLDKVVYSECIKRVVVHSDAAAECLIENGNTVKSYVIPHGCFENETTEELWNIVSSPYTVMQFGFGFSYKGVDDAIRAVAHLVREDEKFKDLYYVYLSSESKFSAGVHKDYYDYLNKLIVEEGVENNVAIIRKYQSEDMLNLYLRLFKVAIFPYISDPDNVVFGASGAIRLAMANLKPIIASSSPMFADVDGVIPRPSNYLEIAEEIDKIFSDDEYRNGIIQNIKSYIESNSWEDVSGRYLDLYNTILKERIEE